jgi:hypothetical protein
MAMNSSEKKIYSSLVVFGLAVMTLCAQSAVPFGDLPLWFESNPDGQFGAHASGSEFSISAGGAEFLLKKSNSENATCKLQLAGANVAAVISGDQPLPGKINRFSGNTSDQWQLGKTVFARVRVAEVYPGMDLVYYGNQKNLEYDFNLAVGADPSLIVLRFTGARAISTNSQGELVVKLQAGEIIQHAPVAYQLVDGTRRPVAAAYQILDACTVKFALGNYDRSQPLVIDPVLAYSTYFGGNKGDTAWAVAVNTNDGSVYLAGQTFSTTRTNSNTMATPGAFDTVYRGGKQAGDAFVARFDNTGTNLIYATYLGGSADDAAYAIAVDGAGNAFVAGATISPDFPIKNPIPTGGIISGKINPHVGLYPTDVFVAELDPNGSNLIYSTFIGGNSGEAAYGIALDDNGDACITGFTYSTNFPVTPDAFQPHLACTNSFYVNANAFISVIAAGGSNLNYSTYFGGTNYDVGRAIAFKNGRLFVAGYTLSTNFPSINPLPGQEFLNGNTNFNKRMNGASDAFVAAFDFSTPSPSVLYSTLLGGTNFDRANGIAADDAGNAYVAGYTMSTNFPFTATNVPRLSPGFVVTNDFRKHFYLVTNGFLTKITLNGSQPAIAWSSVFGGKGANVANAVALDPAGNVYVTGSATCTNFPTTPDNLSGFLSPTNSSRKTGDNRFSDAIIMSFNNDCTALLYSAYLGGRDNDSANAIAVDPAGNAYIAGATTSTNFPAVNDWQSRRNGTNDMFLAKISPDDLLTLNLAPKNSMTTGPLAHTAGMSATHQAGMTLKWKMFPAIYQVESAASFNSTNWKTVEQSPVYTNGWYLLDLPATDSAQFFRLRRR